MRIWVARLRINSPAPISRRMEIATWATTKPLRSMEPSLGPGRPGAGLELLRWVDDSALERRHQTEEDARPEGHSEGEEENRKR